MSKTKISQYDAIPGNNTDIDGINLAEGMAPGLVNNAIRELMSQLKDFQVGSAGDPLTVGGNLAVSGTSTLTGNVVTPGVITMSGRLVDAFPTGTRMLFQQTAAPIGWVKDVANNDRALRVVSGTVSTGGTVGFSSAFVSKAVTGTIANATAGGTVGGTALSVAQLPAHTHTGSGTTGNNNVGHNHTFSGNTGNNNVNHSHAVSDPGHNHAYSQAAAISPGAGGSLGGGDGNLNTSISINIPNRLTGITLGANNANHLHAFSGTTATQSANHNHAFSLTTSSVGSGSTHTHSFTGTAHNHTFTGTAIDLAVQYVDVIICTKS